MPWARLVRNECAHTTDAPSKRNQVTGGVTSGQRHAPGVLMQPQCIACTAVMQSNTATCPAAAWLALCVAVGPTVMGVSYSPQVPVLVRASLLVPPGSVR
jgi:hypothetical protein